MVPQPPLHRTREPSTAQQSPTAQQQAEGERVLGTQAEGERVLGIQAVGERVLGVHI